MYCVYVIKSQATGKYYVGSTYNITGRLERHNGGKNKSTKHRVPWSLVYSKEFETRQDAYKMEFKIKSYKGGKAFKKLVNS